MICASTTAGPPPALGAHAARQHQERPAQHDTTVADADGQKSVSEEPVALCHQADQRNSAMWTGYVAIYGAATSNPLCCWKRMHCQCSRRTGCMIVPIHPAQIAKIVLQQLGWRHPRSCSCCTITAGPAPDCTRDAAHVTDSHNRFGPIICD